MNRVGRVASLLGLTAALVLAGAGVASADTTEESAAADTATPVAEEEEALGPEGVTCLIETLNATATDPVGTLGATLEDPAAATMATADCVVATGGAGLELLGLV